MHFTIAARRVVLPIPERQDIGIGIALRFAPIILPFDHGYAVTQATQLVEIALRVDSRVFSQAFGMELRNDQRAMRFNGLRKAPQG